MMSKIPYEMIESEQNEKSLFVKAMEEEESQESGSESFNQVSSSGN